MSSFSELYFSNSAALPKSGELDEAAPYLLSKFHVPLCWLALFGPENIVDIPTPGGEEHEPYLVGKREECSTLFSSRATQFMSRFPRAKPEWFVQFGAFLESTPYKYVHVDTREVGSMVGSGSKWRADLVDILGIFGDRQRAESSDGLLAKMFARSPLERSWSVFNRHFSAAYAKELGEKPWAYCGASGSDEPMPWEEGYS